MQEVISLALEKCATSLGIEMNDAQAVTMVIDMIDEYKHEAIEDLIFVLQNGRKGRYGKVFGKLNMIVISEWMKIHLEDKARAREAQAEANKKKEEATFISREEYEKWCEKGMKYQETIKKQRDMFASRKNRLSGNDIKFEAKLAMIKNDRMQKGL